MTGGKGPYKVIVLGDLQVPFVDRRSMAAVEEYMADEKWDEWVQIGDFMDLPQLSKFTQENPEALTQSLSDDYKAGNELLDRHQRIVRKRNPRAKFTILCGNHDLRAEKFAEKHPQLKGLIEVDKGLRLKERGIGYIRSYPDGTLYKIGKAYFHHGKFVVQNHSRKMVDSYGVNIFYGHTHDVQSSSKVQWGKNKTLVGQSLGCLCRYDLDYVGTDPTNWQQAVTTFFFMPDGHFSYFISRIFNGRMVAPNGKIYG